MLSRGDRLDFGKIRYIESYHDKKLVSTQKEVTVPFRPRDLMDAHAIIFDETAKLINGHKAKKNITIQIDLEEKGKDQYVRGLNISHLEDVDAS